MSKHYQQLTIMTRLLRILILFLFCLQASQVSYATANDDSLAAITEKLSWIHDQLLEHGTFTFQKTGMARRP